MNEILLSLIASLVGAQILVVRWLMNRGDRAVEKRDEIIEKLLAQLTKAVEHFQTFEDEEADVHMKIVASLEKIVRTQEIIISKLDKQESVP